MELKKILLYYVLGCIIFSLLITFYLQTSLPGSFALNDNGYILTTNKTAYVFAHGRYLNYSTIEAHFTTINGETIATVALVTELKQKGFEKVWLSGCETGNSEYIYRNKRQDLNVSWDSYPYVSKAEFYGNSVPVFVGFGLIHIPTSREFYTIR